MSCVLFALLCCGVNLACYSRAKVPSSRTLSTKQTIGLGAPSLLNKSQGVEPLHRYVSFSMSRLFATLFDAMVHAWGLLRARVMSVLSEPQGPPAQAMRVPAVLRKCLCETYERLTQEAALIGDERKARDWRLLADDCHSFLQDKGFPGEATAHDSDLHWAGSDAFRAIFQSQLFSFQTHYAIWAFAVRNEVMMRNELAAVAAFADDRRDKARALRSAREADRHAAKYRVMRRVAYHSEEQHHHAITFPAINRLQTLDDVGHIAGAIEVWLERLLVTHYRNDQGSVEALKITRDATEFCRTLASGTTPHRRLQQGLRRMNAFRSAYTPRGLQPAQERGEIISECERAFDYYDSVFEASDEADMLEAAQVLSRLAMMRITALRDTAPGETDVPPASSAPGLLLGG